MVDSIIWRVAYNAKIGKEYFDISKADFLAANDKLSAQYHTEQSPEKRRRIVGILYDLDRRMFSEQMVFGEENKRDYQQEMVIYLTRALETFTPGKGSFISWLRWYVLKAQDKVGEAGQKAALTVSDSAVGPDTRESDESAPDSLYWTRIKNGCTKEEWLLLSMQMFESKTLNEAAEAIGITINQAKVRYTNTIKRLRLEAANPIHPVSQINKSLNQPGNDDGSVWLTKSQLCDKLQITEAYLKMLKDREKPVSYCPYYIDPHDILPIQNGRFRYLETRSGGLIYPRILRKKKPAQEE